MPFVGGVYQINQAVPALLATAVIGLGGLFIQVAKLDQSVSTVAARPLPAMTDEERRRRVWANKSVDEQLNVAPAFMQTDPARMAVIEKLGNLKGGVRFLNPGDTDAAGNSIYGGAWHQSSTLQIAMSERDTALQDYQTVMRHEYGHHIDAVIDRHLLAKRGLSETQAAALGGMASRRALSAIAADAKELEKGLTNDLTSGWTGQTVQRSLPAYAAMRQAQEKLLDDLGLLDLKDAPSAYAKLAAEFKKRKLNYDEAVKVAPSIGLKAGRQAGEDWDTFQAVEDATKFLVAYDLGDHYTLMKALASFSQGSLLTGLSDSIGAATIQRLGYQFGHKVLEQHLQKIIFLNK